MSTILVGCGGQTGGLAPSKNETPVTLITDISSGSNFKFGETVDLINGWEMSIDTTDPVEEIVLANSWSVEVKYE